MGSCFFASGAGDDVVPATFPTLFRNGMISPSKSGGGAAASASVSLAIAAEARRERRFECAGISNVKSSRALSGR